MRSGLLSLAAAAALSVAAVPAVAQVTVSPKLVESAVAEVPDSSQTAKVRPNSSEAGVFFVYAQNINPAGLDCHLVVELRGGPKGALIAEGRAEKVPSGQWKVIRFAKPPAPPAPPAAAAPAPGAAPAEPPPPGVAVARGPGGFNLNFKLYEIPLDKATGQPSGPKQEAKVKGKDEPYDQNVAVAFLDPSEYVDGTTKLEKGKSGQDVTATVTLQPKAPYAFKSTAKLTFPTQAGGSPPPRATGLFAGTLDPAVDGGKAVTLGGAFPGGLVTMHLAIDGVERVQVYEVSKAADDKPDIGPVDKPRVRVIPVAGVNVTKPTNSFPVRVEADVSTPNDTLELRIRRKVNDTATAEEVIPLGGPRDEKLWIDVAEPTKQGLGFATKTTDWVKVLDLSSARGKVEVEAVLKQRGVTVIGGLPKIDVTVDATPPAIAAVVQVGDPKLSKEKLLKGIPLPVRATVTDTEAGVRKVTFLMYSRLQDDGTIPPDALKADGVRQPEIDPKTKKPTDKMSDLWTGEFALPADKVGKFQVAAVAVDNAGNDTKPTKDDPNVKVIVIEAPAAGPGGAAAAAPRGSISGIVLFGGRPQPGLPIVVGGGDGKAKAVVYTNDAGKFCIPDVLPGGYTLLTAKTDSNKGFKSQADVTVEPEKTAKVTLELERNKDGR